MEGVTGIRLNDVGNIVHPTDPNGLVVVTQLQPIAVIFTLPETQLPQIQQAMAKGSLSVLAYSEDDKIKLDQSTLAVLGNPSIQTISSGKPKNDSPHPQPTPRPCQRISNPLLI